MAKPPGLPVRRRPAPRLWVYTRRSHGGRLLAIRCVRMLCASAGVRRTAAARALCRTQAPLPIVLGPRRRLTALTATDGACGRVDGLSWWQNWQDWVQYQQASSMMPMVDDDESMERVHPGVIRTRPSRPWLSVILFTPCGCGGRQE